jgi:hypothetical protein
MKSQTKKLHELKKMVEVWGAKTLMGRGIVAL